MEIFMLLLPRVPDAVRHSSCRSAEPRPYQTPASATAPALQRTTPRRAARCAASGGTRLITSVEPSIPQRAAVLARFGAAGQRAFVPVDPDRLGAAERCHDA